MFRKLLAHHPAVHVPRETHFLPLLHAAYGGAGATAASEMFDFIEQVYMARGETILERIYRNQGLEAEAFRSAVLAPFDSGAGPCTIQPFMERFYRVLGEDRGATIVGDKTPDYGLCMEIIQSIWPEAKFIHIVRDGRDVAMSMSKVLSFRILAASGVVAWWELAWRKGYERWLEAAGEEIPHDRFFELWRRRLLGARAQSSHLPPSTYLEIQYDAILRDPASMLRAAASFLALPEEKSWIDAAAATVRSGNRERNQSTPEYNALTTRFAADLRSAGFEV